jgi:hypothetical protein
MRPNSDRLLDAAEILIEQGFRVEAYPVLQLVSDGIGMLRPPTPAQRERLLRIARLALTRRPQRPRRLRLEDFDDDLVVV